MKIALIGHPGSGKTYLAEKISVKLAIDVINLDSIFDKHPEYLILATKYRKAVDELFRDKDSWIVNGYHGKRMPEFIWQQADLIIFIDIEKQQLKKNVKSRQIIAKKNGDFSHWQYSKLNNLKNYSQIRFMDKSLRNNFESIQKISKKDTKFVILNTMDGVNDFQKVLNLRYFLPPN